MPMMSYAQNGEDVVLNRVFPEGGGFFIDVGANDPVESSVTKHFSDRGWHGINIEPEPAAFQRMLRGRPQDLNLNVGISDVEGALTFYDAPDANGWSTFSSGQAANLKAQGHRIIERSIPVTTLSRVCERHVTGTIDFLKIDAESHEKQVITGANWSRWRPRVVLIEANGMDLWEAGFLESGYLFALFDGINRYYVREEDRGLLPLFATMANVSDDFIPYTYVRVIHQLEARIAETRTELDQLSPWVQKVRAISARHPRVRSMMKRVLDRAS